MSTDNYSNLAFIGALLFAFIALLIRVHLCSPLLDWPFRMSALLNTMERDKSQKQKERLRACSPLRSGAMSVKQP
jgi:hypothetical protein